MKNNFYSAVLNPFEWVLCCSMLFLTIFLLAGQYYYFAIIPSLFFLLLLLLSRYPSLGYYLIVFIIPLGSFTSIENILEFATITRVIAIPTVLVTLLYILLRKFSAYSLKSNLWSFLFLFLLVNILSLSQSKYSLVAFDDLRKLLVVYIIFALSLIYVKPEGYLRTLPAIIIISTSLSIFLAIIGKVYQLDFLTVSGYRATGGMRDPNTFSFLVIYAMPILVFWFFNTPNISSKLISLILFVLSVVSVMLTYSRTGAVVLAVLLILLLFKYLRRLRPRYLGFFMITMILVIIAAWGRLLPQSYIERIESIGRTEGDQSIDMRISFLHVGWEAFKENPLFGSGPGTFRNMFAESDVGHHFLTESHYSKYVGTLRIGKPAHNIFMDVLVETGLTGLCIFVVIIGISIKNFKSAEKLFFISGNKQAADITASYRLSLYTMLLAFLFISTSYPKYFWISLALSQIALNMSKKDFKT